MHKSMHFLIVVNLIFLLRACGFTIISITSMFILIFWGLYKLINYIETKPDAPTEDDNVEFISKEKIEHVMTGIFQMAQCMVVFVRRIISFDFSKKILIHLGLLALSAFLSKKMGDLFPVLVINLGFAVPFLLSKNPALMEKVKTHLKME